MFPPERSPLRLALDFDIAETVLGSVHSGQRGEAVLDAYPDKPFAVTVERIAPVASAERGTISLRLSIPDPPPGIRPAMAARVTLLPDDHVASVNAARARGRDTVGGILVQPRPGVSTGALAAKIDAAFLGQQSARTKRLVTIFGWPIALLMAIGAAAGALNTMMSSVADRTAEIATLRVLGFGRSAAFAATFAEALVLSLAGASVGALASYAALDGWQASTLGANGTQTAFQLAVTPAVLLQAGALALLVGAVGGALPAVAATRLPLVTALRGGAS